MSALVGLAGALLLAAATVPQVAKLLRDRRADDFHYGFITLHLVGLALLAMRSAELGEWAFFGINLLGACFWLFVFALKALCLPRPNAAVRLASRA